MQWLPDPNQSNVDNLTMWDVKLVENSGTERRNIES